MMIKKALYVGILFSISQVVLADSVYKWVDENGVTHYSNTEEAHLNPNKTKKIQLDVHPPAANVEERVRAMKQMSQSLERDRMEEKARKQRRSTPRTTYSKSDADNRNKGIDRQIHRIRLDIKRGNIAARIGNQQILELQRLKNGLSSSQKPPYSSEVQQHSPNSGNDLLNSRAGDHFIRSGKGFINPRTGQTFHRSGNGIINQRTGQYLPKSGNGYIDPKTGQYYPAR